MDGRVFSSSKGHISTIPVGWLFYGMQLGLFSDVLVVYHFFLTKGVFATPYETRDSDTGKEYLTIWPKAWTRALRLCGSKMTLFGTSMTALVGSLAAFCRESQVFCF
ncbi:hypothetical protein TNCT_132901 [Trichonephila clavata]|uniref:Uncharacterized protein n=1 Tax=Trichonephila clavata TaxID=2740835 RepID=A0A8X6GVE8_TRICU|nr:hypothetical protein TNCT_3191 [Trichonephila clavata]GFQ99612.1 hypothetical protein TNCT_132901 [Trichonephila clavata]